MTDTPAFSPEEADAELLKLLCDEDHLPTLDEVQRLLTYKPPLTCKLPNSGHTALLMASRKKYEEIALALVDAGADIHARCNRGHTAFFNAVAWSQTDLAIRLIQMGAEVDVRYRGDSLETTARLALYHNSIPLLSAIIDKAPHLLDVIDDLGCSLLHCAAMGGHDDAVQWLVEKGMDIEAGHDEIKSSPLSYAITNGRLSTIKLLCELGANYDRPPTTNHSCCYDLAREFMVLNEGRTTDILLDMGTVISTSLIERMQNVPNKTQHDADFTGYHIMTSREWNQWQRTATIHALTSDMVTRFATIGKLPVLSDPSVWREHPDKLRELIADCHPALARKWLSRMPELAQILAAPAPAMTVWDAIPQGIIQPSFAREVT